VQDASGASLPGATIVAQRAETGLKLTAVSNGAGEYLFAQLPVGAYSLTASATNFKQSTLPRLEVHASDRLRHDFNLQAGDLVDGVTVTGEHCNSLVIAPSGDAIQELNIQKASYAPELGGESGAVINVITRSGSNSFRGGLFEFVRNDVFDAKNFFDSAAAPI